LPPISIERISITTKEVESIADLLRGSEGLLKIDCGQFQTDHETAKLIGIPPGYLDKVKTVPTLLGKV
jgi:ATP-dependent Clp protease ATP-binding subunit ClpA